MALENSLSASICGPHSILRFLVQRPVYFKGNAPSIGPQAKVIFSPKDLCGW